MKIGIMQPYFFPYFGYFGLIKHTDLFVLLDAVQFIRHGWVDRNRILKPREGWQYFRPPLMKHSQSTAISAVRINNAEGWKDRILSQLQHYKKTAPYFREVTEVLRQLFTKDFDTIADLNHASIVAICEYLGIDTEVRMFTAMQIEIEPPQAPDEWALNICRKIPGATEYWNPTGGASFFDRGKYASAGIELKFHLPIAAEYSQRRPVFEASLSIIDMLMFNSVSDTNDLLDRYELG